MSPEVREIGVAIRAVEFVSNLVVHTEAARLLREANDLLRKARTLLEEK
jgi:hypothetical protein